MTYNKDGSGATLRSKFNGLSKVLDNNSANGYSSANESFETQEFELDFTPSSFNGGRRRLSNGVNTSQVLLDSLTNAATITESLVNKTVNMHMSGVNPRVKQFADEPLADLTLHLSAGNNNLEVFCVDMPNTAKNYRPDIVSYDPDCGSLTYLRNELSYSPFGAPSSDVPGNFACGTVKISRKWTVKDKCSRVSSVVQIIYMQPSAPIFTVVPWSSPVSLN